MSVIINRFLESGLLQKGEAQKGRVGQPSVPISLSRDGAFSLGVKIGRRSLDVVLLGFTGEVIATGTQSHDYPRVDDVLARTDEMISELLAPLGDEAAARIVGIGVAAPFSLEAWADELGAPAKDLEAWKEFDIGAAIEQRLGLSVSVMNDATAACVAELVFGRGAEFQSYLYYFVGTFVGGGVVLDGRLYSGQFGNAGAVGSLPIRVAGRNGKTVQLLSKASAIRLEEALRYKGLSVDDVKVAPADHPIAAKWLKEAAEALAQATQSALAIIDFEAIVIDAGLPESFRSTLVELTQQAIKETDLTGLHRPTVVEGTIGREARVRGGALLPLYENFAPSPGVLTKF